MLLVCVMLKVPLWLLHPDVCPTIAKVPDPEPIPIAILPCMVMVFVEELPWGVHDMVMFMLPPFIIPGPI